MVRPSHGRRLPVYRVRAEDRYEPGPAEQSTPKISGLASTETLDCCSGSGDSGPVQRRAGPVSCWIWTLSRRGFDLVDPRASDLCIEEIAHALSLTNRFGGHTPRPYSVAEHSLRVVDWLRGRALPRTLLAGLLHDCAEAYVGDVVKPLKDMVPVIHEYEDQILHLAARRFKFDYPFPDLVLRADREVCAQEITEFFEQGRADIAREKPWTEVRDRFLATFDELGGIR